jgi:ATP-binding cassette subfamily C protein
MMRKVARGHVPPREFASVSDRKDGLRPHPPRLALERCRPHLMAATLFSAVANLLLLTPAIYMMQVYDRVVPTGGLVTLAALSVVGLFALGTLSLLDWLRGRLLVRAGLQLDHELAGRVLRAAMTRPSLSRLSRAEALRDLDTLRQGLSSSAAAGLMDAPWTPIYILVAFLLHPAVGALALASSLLMMALAWHDERRIRGPLKIAGEAAAAAYARQGHITSHAAEVRALGLADALVARQLDARADVAARQTETSFIAGNHASLLKFVRLSLQSGALALGAVLVVDGAMSGGAIFASSLLVSRALQPIEQVSAGWKTILAARSAYDRLAALFADPADERRHTHLPAPTGAITAERLTVASPDGTRVALAEASFAVAAGEIVGVVGMSGAGKSTLLATLAGATTPARGAVRLDGASTADWDPDALARHIGYLPQSFVLFPGTVKENISRFRGALGDDAASVDAAAVAAAQAIGAHEMILRLPQGYDPPLGAGGSGLSAGLTQRIALARALYGSPRLLLLDEPTAHLDAEAQHAFRRTLTECRKSGATVLFATHSGDILAGCDKMLLLREGRVERFGPIAETVPALRPVPHTPQKA